jgi:SpoVK/Ycf46/Vps4 family AAA+-type ATPase
MKQKDPTSINNFNKLLCNLDEISKKNQFSEPTEKNNLKTEEEMKEFIDEMIKNLDENFEKNDFSSFKFTGQTLKDIVEANSKINVPNEYMEIEQPKNCCRPKITINQIIKKVTKKAAHVEIKEHINIDVEVNNISDILKLIDTYKDDPSIKYNINVHALHNIKEPLQELNNMVGMNDLKNNIVDQILYFIQDLHKDKTNNGDFMHTVIYGPPGTGKTEIAKIMGKIFSKLGILNKGSFKKVTRSDLIAGYLGQTALKTKDVIKEALGGVLFIDEAYALGSSEKRDSFAKECIDTLCEALSDYKENLMVIIAGYEMELKDCFFDYNQGLDSRFTWRFKTDDYTYEDLYKIFLKKLDDIGWNLDENSGITSEWFKKNKDYLKFYGRDIETILAKTKISHSRRVFCKPDSEKRKILLKDLDNGLKIFLKSDDVKNRKQELQFKKDMYNTLYS